MRQLSKTAGRKISTSASAAASAAKKGIMKSPVVIRKSGGASKDSHAVSGKRDLNMGGRHEVNTDNDAASRVLESNENKWLQPVLDDGTKVPLAQSSITVRDNHETFVELSVSFCRDILSCRDGPLDLLDGSGNVAGSTKRKFFCVVYAAKPKVAESAENAAANTDGRDDVDESGGDRESLPPGCVELGQTGAISSDSTTPKFKAKFVTSLRFRLDTAHDIIVLLRAKNDETLLGRTTFRLERMIRSAGLCESSQTIQSIGGSIVMKARSLDEHLVFCLAGKDLKTKRGGAVIRKKRRAQNPYIIISHNQKQTHAAKANSVGDENDNCWDDVTKETSSWSELWRSEVYRDEDEETDHFGFGRINMTKVGGEEAKIRVSAFDWDDKNQSYKLIGQVDSTIRDFLRSKQIDVTRKGKLAGSLVVRFADLVNIPDMTHYLRGKESGTALDLMVAIDFTSSNGGTGDPNSEGCLHRTCLRPNNYEAVLRKIGDVFDGYIGSGMRQSAWGFGAIDSEGQLNHRFALGGDEGACDGTDGLLSAYGNTLRSGIILSGPKLIRPSLDSAIERALQNSQWRPSYSVLVVLCSDGKIADLTEAIEKLTQASYAPLSIVFVGVGDGEFSDFSALAQRGKEAVLESLSGNDPLRDIAHFIRLSDLREDMDIFTHRALQKIPSQFIQHHMSSGLFPSDEIEEEDGIKQEKHSKSNSNDLDESTCENLLEGPPCNEMVSAKTENMYETDLLQLDFETLHTTVAPSP